MNHSLPRTLVAALVVGLSACSAPAADTPDDFTVNSATSDAVFQLAKHRDKTVVLHFLLKTECPICLKYTHDYAALAAKTPDVVHVFLKPDTAAEIKAWAGNLDAETLKTGPAIYRDPDAQLAEKFKIPNGYKFHGQTVHYPALVILDGKGKEVYRYVGKNNGDRLAVKDFTAKLAELKAKK